MTEMNNATHRVCMWLDNVENLYFYWLHQAEEAVEYLNGDLEEATEDLAMELEETLTDFQIESAYTEIHTGLLTSILNEVDWSMIANEFIEECKE